MRVLLDTNVLIAAFISQGSCNELLEHCFQDHQIVTSSELVSEFVEVLSGKFGYTRDETREARQILLSMVTFVDPEDLPTPVCRDPDDDRVLAAAVGGAAACIVTGDNDLLELEEHLGISILRPSEFWSFEDA